MHFERLAGQYRVVSLEIPWPTNTTYRFTQKDYAAALNTAALNSATFSAKKSFHDRRKILHDISATCEILEDYPTLPPAATIT
jgi:L-rhamnose isomerase